MMNDNNYDNNNSNHNSRMDDEITVPHSNVTKEETAPPLTMKDNKEGEEDDFYSTLGFHQPMHDDDNIHDETENVDSTNNDTLLQEQSNTTTTANTAANTAATTANTATATAPCTTKAYCSEKIYSDWICPQWIRSIPDKWPRTNACICGIFIPLAFLMLLAVLCGSALARYEYPIEIATNDEILAEKFLLHRFDLDRSIHQLLELPKYCFLQFLNQSHVAYHDNQTFEEIIDQTLFNPYYDQKQQGNSDPDMFIVIYKQDLLNLDESFQECKANVSATVDRILEIYDDIGKSGDYSNTLTFNWARCWNYTDLGHQLKLRPAYEDIEAAKNQKHFYSLVWLLDQQRLYNEYFQEKNGTDIIDALTRSAEDATGKDFCQPNSSGVAWFWFTIMTTIGYGNQAPVTSEGRLMVACLGVVTILAFGGILATAGGIVGVLYDDIVTRSGWTCLGKPVVAALIWALVTAGWILFLARFSYDWWQNRWESDYASGNESIWFSFMTTTTIGLGDFFLQPEVIFGQDLFLMTSIVLVGFVFLAAMLGQISEVISIFLPDYVKNLKRRVERTNMFDMNINHDDTPSREWLEKLVEMTELDQSLSRDETRNLQIIKEEEEILRNLLDRKVAQRTQLEARAADSTQ